MWLLPPLPRTLGACLRDVKSAKPKVRAGALADLARHGREPEHRAQALHALVAALGDDEPQVRAAAAVGAADLRATEATPRLLVCIEDDDGYVREMALVALGEIGDPAALPRLRRALHDERPEVRYQAVIAFARIAQAEDDEVAEALARGAADDDLNVRYVALRSAEDRFGRAPPRSILDVAARRLDDPACHVANAAAILLCRGGDERGKARVLRIVAGAERASREDERGAIEVAGERGYAQAQPALARRAWGLVHFVRETSAWHAKIALARMGDERAAHDILGDLTSMDRDKRQAAVVAAGRARLASARAAVLSARDVDEDLRREALGALERPEHA